MNRTAVTAKILFISYFVGVTGIIGWDHYINLATRNQNMFFDFRKIIP
jgi:hypothetical protein